MKPLLLASAALLLVLPASPAAGELPHVNGRIAFELDRGGGWSSTKVAVANQDGSGQRTLATGRQPAWSPDGTMIAYVSGDPYPNELAVMNADGTGQHLVNTGLGPHVGNPSWSADGRQILVSAFGDIFAVPPAGGNARLLIREGAYGAWSPDGSSIAFVRWSRSPQMLMVANPDGSGARALTPVDGSSFSWSPDSTRIAFTRSGGGSIDAIGADGTGTTQLLPPGNYARSLPAWSPDGTRIAFRENGDLCTAALDGSKLARLTYTPINPGRPPANPAWQPLPHDSTPAGEPGRSAGPTPDYPRGTAWYPSCDKPDDDVTISSTGPSFAMLGSWVTYTVKVENSGTAPISPVNVSLLSGRAVTVPPVPSQGRCGSNCELGGFVPGERATIEARVRPSSPGMFTYTAIKGASASNQHERRTRIDTDVVRCTIHGTRHADHLRGTASTDVLCGLAGNDVLNIRGGGPDTVFCGSGFDTVFTNAGSADRIAPDCERVVSR